MTTSHLSPEFVEFIPHELAEGVIYITITHRTAVHLCPCGCRNKVPTPITPADWHLLYDGMNVSLSPSVGNWGLPCRSHYLIKKGNVVWSRSWSDEEIKSGREMDDLERAAQFGETAKANALKQQAGRAGRRWRRRS